MRGSGPAEPFRETAASATAVPSATEEGSHRGPAVRAARIRSIQISTPLARPVLADVVCRRAFSKGIPWSHFWPHATGRAPASRSRSSSRQRTSFFEAADQSQDPKDAARRSASPPRATSRRTCRKTFVRRPNVACLATARTTARTSASVALAVTLDPLARRSSSARVAEAPGAVRLRLRCRRTRRRISAKRLVRVGSSACPARRYPIRRIAFRAAPPAP
jgi:hypothetical protein